MKKSGTPLSHKGFALAFLALVSAKPIALDWRSVELPSFNWNRLAVDGGGALFTVPGSGEKKFRLDFHFGSGLYSFPKERMVEVEAFADLLLLGGAGRRSYEELTNFLQENGIQAQTETGSQGELVLTLSGLSEDLPQALRLAEDILLKPRFAPEALELWKQDKNDEFQALLDAGSQGKQKRFISYELNKLSLGPTHTLTQTLKRMGPKSVNAINAAYMPTLAQLIINRAGLNLFLSGGFTSKDEDATRDLLSKIPRRNILPTLWLPERPAQPSGNSIRFAVINRPDLKQAQVEMRVLTAKSGQLNQLEKSHLRIAGEVLSASGGVVGTDRWSKAMRADSGLSYSPGAYFSENMLIPNTNVGLWRLIFQSPNERIYEACVLAKKTWDEFAAKGIANDEAERARVGEMNSILARESTVFDKADALIASIVEGEIPVANGRETALARLESARDTQTINSSLQRMAKQDTIPVMVIFGNPDNKQIARLKKEPGFEFVELVPFSALVKEISE